MKQLLFTLLFLSLIIPSVRSQNVFGRKNLTQLPVDQLSEQEIINFKRAFELQKSTGNKLNNRSLYSPELQVKQLQDSLMAIKRNDEFQNRRTLSRYKNLDSLVFGSELFQLKELDFAPNLNIAAPPTYRLGVGDELNIEVFGFQETNSKLKVTKEGTIFIPYAGVVSINGLTLEEGREKIKRQLIQNGYNTLRTGQSTLLVSLGSMRSIHVTVIGVKKPGMYTLPATSTALHALHVSGGPAPKGSYRNIRIIRNGKVFKSLDLYDLLLTGTLPDAFQLEDDDIVFIPVYDKRISFKGEFKRPRAFELLPGESLRRALFFAGGFTEAAYTSSVALDRVSTTALTSVDVLSTEFESFALQNGDVITAQKLLDEYTTRIAIGGAVRFPGYYSFKAGITVEDVLIRAGGLRDDAFLNRGLVSSKNSAGVRSYHKIDLSQGASVLEDGDSLIFLFLNDVVPPRFIRVEGEVNSPGKYFFGTGITLNDALLLAGGFKLGAATDRIEVVRRVNSGEITSRLISIATNTTLDSNAPEYSLEAEDVIIVGPDPNYREPEVVSFHGEFTHPGFHPLLTRQERLSTVIQRSGGLTQYANLDGAFIIRKLDEFKKDETKSSDSKKVAVTAKKISIDKDTINSIGNGIIPRTNSNLRTHDTIALHLKKVLKTISKKDDFILKDGDKIHIPQIESVVFLRGELNRETQVAFKAGESFRDYISQGGGINGQGDDRRAYVVYPNGSSKKIVFYVGIVPHYPKMKPGSTLFVPKKSLKKNNALSPSELGALSAAFGTLGTLTLAILTYFN